MNSTFCKFIDKRDSARARRHIMRLKACFHLPGCVGHSVEGNNYSEDVQDPSLLIEKRIKAFLICKLPVNSHRTSAGGVEFRASVLSRILHQLRGLANVFGRSIDQVYKIQYLNKKQSPRYWTSICICNVGRCSPISQLEFF